MCTDLSSSFLGGFGDHVNYMDTGLSREHLDDM